MAAGEYPFIDIAVHDNVREHFSAGAPVIVLSADLDRTIWANGPGAALFGHDDVESVIGDDPGLGTLAKRQLRGLSGFPDIGNARPVTLRIASGHSSAAIMFNASEISLADGVSAIMLAAAPSPSARSPKAIARNMVSGIARPGHHAACIDADGAVLAATDDFSELAISAETLRGLVGEVRDETDRMIKRRVDSALGPVPAGFARLSDDPARHLLVVVAEGEGEEEIGDMAGEVHEPDPASETATDNGPEPANDDVPAVSDELDHGEGRKQGDEPDTPKPVFGQRRSPPETDAVEPAGDDIPAAVGGDDGQAAPIRFVWKTDKDGLITDISDSFIQAVGVANGDVRGRTFAEIAKALSLDPGGEIQRLMERRDTWSGRQVMWPLSERNARIPVDLAALPIYDRSREFKGFRGFGVARIGEVSQGEQVEAPLGAEAGGHSDPFEGEVPALEFSTTPGRRKSDRVIELSSRRRDENIEPAAETRNPGSLSDDERSAFREIADRLKKGTQDDAPSPLAFGKRRPLPEKKKKKKREAASGDGDIGAADAKKPEDTAGAEDKTAPGAKEALSTPPVVRAEIPSAFAGLARVVSERKAKREVLSTLQIPVVIYSDQGVRFANPAFFKATGYSDIEEFDEAGGIEALFIAASDHGDTPREAGFDGETRISTRSGDSFAADTHLHSVPWEGTKALMLSLVERPAPEVKPAGFSDEDIALMQGRIDELVSILDTATDGVVTINEDATIRTINRSAEALFGYENEEIAGEPFSALFAVESQQTARDYLTGLSEHGVASLLNDGREVIGREVQGRFIPLFMTIGKLPGSSGFCAVMRDITQWKRTEDELTEARRVAEQSSSQKTEFLARISHEIRTPLNAIIGFSELMLDEKFGPINNERYRDYLGDISKSGSHVLDLVNDLLDISKIEAGQLELDYEAVSLNEALADAIAIIQPQANRERVIVRSSLTSGLPDVVADLRSIRQISLNLLSNAIRYTLAGGQVIVSTAYEADGSVVLRVRDTGVGMSQVEINQALKPFRQINALKRTHDKGSGLGLPLTKAMVEANRAKFGINSTPGEGTLVEITFPPARVLAD